VLTPGGAPASVSAAQPAASVQPLQPVPVAPPLAPPGTTVPAYQAGMICPICQTEIGASEQFLACSVCGQVHHQECWNEIGGCATYGCTQAPALEKDAPPVQPQSAWGDTKLCPVCAERVKSIAVKCRYCGFDFGTVDPLTADDVRQRIARGETSSQLQVGIILLFIASIILPCLAPITLIVIPAWLWPKRADVKRTGPIFVVLAVAAFALSVLYSVLIAVFTVAQLAG
jgi:hypothetical protein